MSVIEREGIQGEDRIMVQLEPIDLLLFREARPFEASTNVRSGLPSPQTVAGALRTAILNAKGVCWRSFGNEINNGSDFKKAIENALPDHEKGKGAAIESVRFRGPWFGREHEGKKEILLPIPASLKKVEGNDKMVRLDPLNEEIPGWEPKIPGMIPLWVKESGKLESLKCYLTTDGMIEFLKGNVPESYVEAEDLYDFDVRTGISIDPNTSVVKEGEIYTVGMLALKSYTYLIVEIIGQANLLDEIFQDIQIIQLGGEGRKVRLRKLDNNSGFVKCMDFLNVPKKQNSENKKRIIVLTTPALFENKSSTDALDHKYCQGTSGGWYPNGIFEPLSVAVSNFEAYSGWDLAKKCPKPNQFAVPAGTVYYLKPGDEISSAFGHNIGNNTEIGWGSFIEGEWNYA